MKQFTVLKGFWAEINGVRTDYCEGMTYTIKDGNTALLQMAQRAQDEAAAVVIHNHGEGPIDKRMQVTGRIAVR